MSKILVLAESGFGKSTAIGPVTRQDFEAAGVPDTEIIGLNPEETFIISATNKGLPIPRWRRLYKTCNLSQPPTKQNGNHAISNDGQTIADIISFVNQNRPDIKVIVLDDSNYIMQDYYMAKATTSGYDVFKKIGQFMGAIFNEMERVSGVDKHFIMMAHMEEYKNSNQDTISYRFKTVGKMVQDYITPEGKFEIVLFGKQTFEEKDGVKKVKKEFVTNYDGQYPAKSPIGMFPQLYIPNDLGMVVNMINEYNG